MLIKEIIATKLKANYQRQQIEKLREQRFRHLLHYAFTHSEFYQSLYQDHGVRENMLADIPISELPVINKRLLMDNFDIAVTDKRLTKAELSAWLHNNQNYNGQYLDKYQVVHTSGSSGETGIFPWNNMSWHRAMASIVARLSKPTFHLDRKNRMVFIGAIDGLYCGVSFAQSSPDLLYQHKLISVFSRLDEMMAEINAYQPDQIIGYSKIVGELARAQLNGELNINPELVSTSGEPLSTVDGMAIEQAWPVKAINLYVASEALLMAASKGVGEPMYVFDDLNWLEYVGADNEVLPMGERGRVCLTNLSNEVLPIIRYKMDDLATGAEPVDDEVFSKIADFVGRDNPAIVFMNNDGKPDVIHPSLLEEFFVPGLESFQFFVLNNDMKMLYVADSDISNAIQAELFAILEQKSADKAIQVKIERVDKLLVNEKTGKFKLINVGQNDPDYLQAS